MPIDRRAAIVVLASGTGTNLQVLLDACADGRIDGSITAVFSDRFDAQALERARAIGVPAHHVPVGPSRDAHYDHALTAAVRAEHPDLVVLAGYMRILSPEFAREFGDRLINLHPALLPRHRGLDTHRRVLEAGDAFHGATVHFVIAELDAGPRIIQYRFPIAPADTPKRLAERVRHGEHIILPRAVELFATGRLRLDRGRVMLDGKLLDEPILVEEAT
jgi:phosphoribosylglycinamide formyltransferase-1